MTRPANGVERGGSVPRREELRPLTEQDLLEFEAAHPTVHRVPPPESPPSPRPQVDIETYAGEVLTVDGEQFEELRGVIEGHTRQGSHQEIALEVRTAEGQRRQVRVVDIAFFRERVPEETPGEAPAKKPSRAKAPEPVTPAERYSRLWQLQHPGIPVPACLTDEAFVNYLIDCSTREADRRPRCVSVELQGENGAKIIAMGKIEQVPDGLQITRVLRRRVKATTEDTSSGRKTVLSGRLVEVASRIGGGPKRLLVVEHTEEADNTRDLEDGGRFVVKRFGEEAGRYIGTDIWREWRERIAEEVSHHPDPRHLAAFLRGFSSPLGGWLPDGMAEYLADFLDPSVKKPARKSGGRPPKSSADRIEGEHKAWSRWTPIASKVLCRWRELKREGVQNPQRVAIEEVARNEGIPQAKVKLAFNEYRPDRSQGRRAGDSKERSGTP